MIKVNTYELPITAEDAIKTEVYVKEDTIYDTEKSILTYSAKTVSGEGIRMIHDTKKVLTLIQGSKDNMTTTIHPVEEFLNEKDLLDRINKLNLECDEELWANLGAGESVIQ